MAGIVGQEDYWVAGSRFYFIKTDDTTYETLFDLGVIKTANPNITPDTIELIDGDGGIQRTVDETLIKVNEDYDIVCNNFTLDNLSLLFLASEPEEFTQPSGSDLDDVPHKATIGPGRMIKLKDVNGNWLYSVSSIVVTGDAGSPSYTEGDDWEWVSKDRGIIQVLTDGDITDGEDLEITIVLNAISGKRYIRPQSAGKAIRGKAMLVWGRNNNAEQTVREFDCSIVPGGSSIQIENYSEMTLKAKVLSDATDTTTPAGRMLQYKGSLPAGPTS